MYYNINTITSIFLKRMSFKNHYIFLIPDMLVILKIKLYECFENLFEIDTTDFKIN